MLGGAPYVAFNLEQAHFQQINDLRWANSGSLWTLLTVEINMFGYHRWGKPKLPWTRDRNNGHVLQIVHCLPGVGQFYSITFLCSLFCVIVWFSVSFTCVSILAFLIVLSLKVGLWNCTVYMSWLLYKYDQSLRHMINMMWHTQLWFMIGDMNLVWRLENRGDNARFMLSLLRLFWNVDIFNTFFNPKPVFWKIVLRINVCEIRKSLKNKLHDWLTIVGMSLECHENGTVFVILTYYLQRQPPYFNS